ncbi:hypothetical protein BZA02_103212 [Ruegeria sp. P4]|nr:hypothetical protein BZA02_103212 [Ruegeria sp. P4]
MPHSGLSDQNRGKASLPNPVAQHVRHRDALLIWAERNLVFREMSAKLRKGLRQIDDGRTDRCSGK